MARTVSPAAGYHMGAGQSLSLLALRVSIGALMIVWGLDKLANPAHGVAVAGRFYFGLFDSASAMPVLGVGQITLGLLVVAGVSRRYAYPALAAVTGMTLLGVWRSVVDPWGWVFEGTNALFFPSLIIFAGVLVLIAFREMDELHLGRAFVASRPGNTAAPGDAHPAPSASSLSEYRSR